MTALRTRRTCDRAAQEAAAALQLPTAVLVLLEGGRLRVAGAYGLEDDPGDWPFLWNAVLGRGPFVVGDTARDPRVTLRPDQSVPGVRCFAAVPVASVRGGLGTGALGVVGSEPQRLPVHAVEALLRVRDDLLHRVDVGVL